MMSVFVPSSILLITRRIINGTEMNENSLISFENTKDTNLLDVHNKHLQIRNEINLEKSRKMNANKSEKFFKIGDLVTIRNFKIADIGGGALKQAFEGPYMIVSINKTERSAIVSNLDNGAVRGVHLMHLRKLGTDETGCPVPLRTEANNLNNKLHDSSYSFRDRKGC